MPAPKVTRAKKKKDDREVNDRKGKETEYPHAEKLDLGGGFNRATDTRMHERGEPESGADQAWRGRQRIPQHMTQNPAPEVTRAERGIRWLQGQIITRSMG